MPLSENLFQPASDIIFGEFSTTYEEMLNFVDEVSISTSGIGNLALKVCTLGAFRITDEFDGSEIPLEQTESGDFELKNYTSPSRLIEPYPGTINAGYLFTGTREPDVFSKEQMKAFIPLSVELFGGRILLWGDGEFHIGGVDKVLRTTGIAFQKRRLTLKASPDESLESDDPEHMVYRSSLVPLGTISVPR